MLVAACGSGDSDGKAAPSPVKGVIVEISDAGGTIRAFRIDADGGDEFTFTIDPAQNYGFDLRHLEEHQRTRQPVVVESVVRDGKTYATTIVDA